MRAVQMVVSVTLVELAKLSLTVAQQPAVLVVSHMYLAGIGIRTKTQSP
jgi:hypothetical protein